MSTNLSQRHSDAMKKEFLRYFQPVPTLSGLAVEDKNLYICRYWCGKQVQRFLQNDK